jgi:Transposase, Mutator family
VLFIDAINVKIREGQVASRPIYLALGVTVDGERDVLGLWAGEHGDGEGARFWLRVLAEIKNRGTRDVCMLVCDGLKGLPDAVSAVWEKTIVQTCIVHYPDTVVMPIPGGPVLAGGGARVRDIGIITGLRGRPGAGRVAGSGRAGLLAGWSGRGLAA